MNASVVSIGTMPNINDSYLTIESLLAHPTVIFKRILNEMGVVSIVTMTSIKLMQELTRFET